MATPISNTYTTPDAVGGKESLANIVARVDPVNTPLYSNSSKTEAKSPLHEWQEWSMDEAPPVTIEYKLEGEVPDRNVATVTRLLNNPTSILSRDYVVSGTLASVDVAGRVNEMAWSRTMRALELKAQVETALLADNVKVPGDDPRENAGLPNYANGADGSSVSGATPINTPAALEVAMALLLGKGVVGRTVLILPANKITFSGTTHTAVAKDIEASMTDRRAGMWNSSVSVYLTDFGPVQLVIDRYLDETLDASFVMDERQVRIAEVVNRTFTEKVLGTTGDANQRLLIWEGTLEATAPNAVGVLGTP